MGRRNTRQSLASEILEQRRKAAETSGTNDGDEDYGLFYLAKRMAPIIRDQWKNYLIGSFFACSMYPSLSNLECDYLNFLFALIQ